jgi:hypothetical protein
MNSILYRTRKAQPQSRQDRLRKSLVFTPFSNLTVDARWSASLPFPYCTSLHLFWPLIHFHEWLQLFPNRFMSHQDNQPLPFLAAFLSAVYSYVSNALFLQGLGRSLKTGEAKSKHRKWPIRRYLRAPLSRTTGYICTHLPYMRYRWWRQLACPRITADPKANRLVTLSKATSIHLSSSTTRWNVLNHAKQDLSFWDSPIVSYSPGTPIYS